MSQFATSIYCPNPLCQTANRRGSLFCERCDTYIPHRYLWSIEPDPIQGKQPGDLIDDRYCLIHSQVLLDTKPSHTAIFPEVLSERALRYADLFKFRTNIPQIYGFLAFEGEHFPLLENSAIYPQSTFDATGNELTGQLMPRLVDCWSVASDSQKATWLYQLAVLWQPLGRLGKTGTVLTPNLVRVDGDIVKILNLKVDTIVNPSLANLAEILLTEIPHLAVEPTWGELFQKMIQQEIISSDQLIELLDHDSLKYRQIQTTNRGQSNDIGKVSISTLTNRGPTRPKNEDACYPASETSFSQTDDMPVLIVVCDGIGGHEGGSFASNSAIATVTTHLQNFQPKDYTSDQITSILEAAVAMANDTICDRNDQERRQERQRMGTTIVLAFLNGNHLYITHIGDSRAYRVSRTGCYQITVDDDLASRETILGHSFYREALQYPATGSLTQALGMAASNHLQPTTQQFILTEDCIFLLCSDGLSDFDRIDESWQTELLPVLEGKRDLYSACQGLIEMANTRNGHDNVTVGLLHFRGEQNARIATAGMMDGIRPATESTVGTIPATRVATVSNRSTDRSNSGLLKIFLGLIGLGLVGGAGFWWWYQARQNAANPSITAPQPTVAGTLSQVKVGQILRVEATPNSTAAAVLLSEPGQAAGAVVGALPRGAIVQVTGEWAKNPQDIWWKLKVCTVPNSAPSQTPSPTPSPTLVAGMEGWQMASRLSLSAPPALPVEQLGNCQTLTETQPSPQDLSPEVLRPEVPKPEASTPVIQPSIQPSVSPLPTNQAQ